MKFLSTLICIAFSLCLFSQEIITDLSTNSQKKEALKNYKSLSSEKSSSLLLPFRDDFSGHSVFPNAQNWADNYAFINNTYAINPITVGVATLDALNDSGAIYAHANPSQFIADHLTSNPIRLDSFQQGSNLVPIKISDSIYFSFFYQPQGIGNAPEAYDSLVLEFYAPTEDMWYWIWSAKGESYQSFFNTNQKSFKHVMIPVTDSLLFFHKEFQFRFKNYASIANTYEPSWAGNVDHWHLDYVYLNINRNVNDTVYEDVAFMKKPTSLLQKYHAVPWHHYTANPALFPVLTQIELPYVNLSDITKNVNRGFAIIDKADNSNAFTYSGGNLNLQPFTEETFNIPVSYTFSSTATDSALFELRAIVNTTPDINRRNDTVRYHQRFNNYYAYDDGSPENGYGLTPANSKLAYKFTINSPDTLKKIQMFFNQTYNDANAKNFFLTVWTGNQYPENVIYEKANIKPIFEDSLNKFHTYDIDTTLVVSGNFFVGWRQTTNDNLNIGFDRNSNASAQIFYNTSGTWMNSMYNGALMIRPVFGKIFNVGIKETNQTHNISLQVYPNPLNSEILNIRIDDMRTDIHEYNFVMFDMIGKRIMERPLDYQIHIPIHLENGMYFYTLIHKNTATVTKTQKLILLR